MQKAEELYHLGNTKPKMSGDEWHHCIYGCTAEDVILFPLVIIYMILNKMDDIKVCHDKVFGFLGKRIILRLIFT